MPGIHIDFTKEQYDLIPSPKRTWIRDLVLGQLTRAGEKTTTAAEAEAADQEFVFKTPSGVLRGAGPTPARAAEALGIIDVGPLVQWRTVAEALKEGWIKETVQEDNPLDL